MIFWPEKNSLRSDTFVRPKNQIHPHTLRSPMIFRKLSMTMLGLTRKFAALLNSKEITKMPPDTEFFDSEPRVFYLYQAISTLLHRAGWWGIFFAGNGCLSAASSISKKKHSPPPRSIHRNQQATRPKLKLPARAKHPAAAQRTQTPTQTTALLPLYRTPTPGFRRHPATAWSTRGRPSG